MPEAVHTDPFEQLRQTGKVQIRDAKRKLLLEYEPNPKQLLAHTCGADEIFYGGAMYGGKALSVDSAVITPFGPKRMGDVQVGDRVSNPDGTVARVLAVHPQGLKPLYRVEMSDGAATVTTDDHLWLARRAATKYKAQRRHIHGEAIVGRLYTTRQLRRILGEGVRRPLLPMTRPVPFTVTSRYPDGLRPIPAYLLGLLIGDGCFRGSSVGFSTVDEELLLAIARLSGVKPTRRGQSNNYGLCDGGALLGGLRQLHLNGKLSHEKFIPDQYRVAPLDVRWDIIQGLMDTDGTVGTNGNVSYCTTSERLARDAAWILRSLGFRATITTRQGRYKDEAGECVETRLAYNIYIQGRNRGDLFRLDRKKKRCPRDAQRAEWRAIKSIEPMGEGQAQCITVDHPNGLFLADDFIVTHNSFWIIWHNALHCLKWGKDANTILFRRVSDDLKRSLIGEMIPMFDGILGNYKVGDMVFDWINGATTWFRHLEDADDVLKHRSAQYTLVGFDELTTFLLSQYTFLFTRNRSPKNPHIHCQVIGASNPRGLGHRWVKDRFLTDKEPETLYKYMWDDKSPAFKGMPTHFEYTRCFIPAKAKDNEAGLKNDPQYLMRLKVNLPPDEYKAYVEGNWDMTEDTAFPEWDESVHVVDPFPIPDGWKIVRGFDHGYSRPFSVGWYAQDPDSAAIYRIDEWYGCKVGPEGGIQGVRMSVEEIKQGVIDRENVRSRLSHSYPPVWYGMADPQIFAPSGIDERSVADVLNRGKTLFRPAEKHKGSRMVGKQVIHNLLRINPETGKPGLMVFRTCKHFLRTVPQLQLDPKKPEDVETKQEDHIYDEARYVLVGMTRNKPQRRDDMSREKIRAMNVIPRLV